MSRYPVHNRLIRRLYKGFGALSFGGVIRTATHVIVVPVFLYSWGSIQYGEWIALTGLVAFLQVLDLGLERYVVNQMCSTYANERLRAFHRFLHSALRYHFLLTGIAFAVTIALVWHLPLADFFGFQSTSGLDLRLAVIFLAVETLSGVPMRLVIGIYRATGRLSRGALIEAFHQLFMLILIVTLVLNDVVFSVLAGARLVLTLGLLAYVLRDLVSLYPWLRLKPDSADWKVGGRMLLPGALFLLIPIADYIAMKLTVLIIQRFASGAEVSEFMTHKQYANFPRMWGNYLVLALWPELTALDAIKDESRLRRLLEVASQRTVALVGFIVILVGPAAPWIYPLWTTGELSLDPLSMTLLIFQSLLWAVWSVSMTYLMATNRHQYVGLILLGGAAITASLALTLVPRWGTSGAAIALVVGDILGPMCFFPWLASRHLGMPLREIFRGVFRIAGRLIAPPLVLAILSQILFDSVALKALGIGISLVLAMILLKVVLSSSEERLIRDESRRLLSKIRGSGDSG